MLISTLSLYKDKIAKILNKYILCNRSDLIVPWNKVRMISMTNERFDKVLLASYVNLGNWYIITFDGKYIVINDIEAPENKLNYIRIKFNLNL
ncbi:hypothetical protein EWF20_11445 [Sulfolobus sp. S-194]|uniref:hypothetical protein n=1 Tax=Sulfolobus sp. S-194 TaxID=2512240 RepID=UPI00143710CD|nr:hypothetical protein [Sulfolobus sp. S-194]QIW24684.1 hypothetical protein EWF20_11445 [Sulfolobus sp. S-194]